MAQFSISKYIFKFRKKLNKKRLHKQFLNVQKWQSEMYNDKADNDIH